MTSTSVESYSKNFEKVLDIAIESFIYEIMEKLPDLKTDKQEFNNIWMAIKSKKTNTIKLKEPPKEKSKTVKVKKTNGWLEFSKQITNLNLEYNTGFLYSQPLLSYLNSDDILFSLINCSSFVLFLALPNACMNLYLLVNYYTNQLNLYLYLIYYYNKLLIFKI